jgi:hypothetical protein
MMDWKTIITSAGVSGVVAAGVAWLLKTVIGEKLRAAIQHEYNEKLESFRAKANLEMERLRESASQVQAVHAVAMETVLESHRAAQERRLAAIETFWKAMVHLRMTVSNRIALSDIFSEEEYLDGTACQSDAVVMPLKGVSHELLAEQASENDKEVQLARAFGSEYMYALFFAYRALVFTITIKLIKGVREGKMQPWFRDDGIRKLLASVFTEKELQALDASPAFRLRQLQESIERKMLGHISEITTGKALSQTALEHASKMLAAAMKLQSQWDARRAE